MRLHLVRHGQTDRNDCLIGRTDAALTIDGIAQVNAVLQNLDYRHVVTSSLQRCQPMALAAAERHGVACRIDDDWVEMDFGDWDGLPVRDIRARYAEPFRAFYTDPDRHPPPGGESWRDVCRRVDRALRTTLGETDHAPVLIMTHGGAMRAALSVACGYAFDQLWAFRLAHGTRLTLEIGVGPERALWGEIIALSQADPTS